MIGKRFGRLVVTTLLRVDSYTQENGLKQRVRYFECLCDCGTVKVIRQSGLRSTKSCGCLLVDENKSRTLDLSGQTFERLTAVSKDVESGKWNCVCSCGTETLVDTTCLRIGETKSCGCLQKEKASASLLAQHKEKRKSRGLDEDTPMSSSYNLERLEFKPLSLEIMKRDSFTCAWCSKKGGELNVHHLEGWAENPDLRFTKSNLVTLCISCHKDVHKFGNNTVDPYMNILLQGYSNVMEDGYSNRIELTPN